MLVELKHFFKKFQKLEDQDFVENIGTLETLGKKNSKSSEFYFEGIWRCDEEVCTTWSKFYLQCPLVKC
jgi:hypothetical protein